MDQDDALEAPRLNLRQKMVRVMNELGYIKKRGHNSFSNYDYVMAADVAAECAKLMAQHGIAFSASEESVEWGDPRPTAKGGTMYVCRARMLFTFMDTESDERIAVRHTGVGTDTMDKEIFKGKTGALKYALVQTFLIATGDDPEGDEDDKRSGGALDLTTTVCPKCHQAGFIQRGNPQFGGAFYCAKKAGGCGANFADEKALLPPEATFKTEEEKTKLKLVPDMLTPEKMTEIEKAIDAAGSSDEEKAGMLTYYKVDSLDKLSLTQADNLLAILAKRIQKRASR